MKVPMGFPASPQLPSLLWVSYRVFTFCAICSINRSLLLLFLINGFLAAIVASPNFDFTAGTEAVRCFCDARSCDDALCSGSWCLVGFQSDVRLVQNCGTYSAHALKDCRLNWGSWEEVCSCQEDFCNTFSYLRTKVKPLRERKETATFTRVDPKVKEGAVFNAGTIQDPSNRKPTGIIINRLYRLCSIFYYCEYCQ